MITASACFAIMAAFVKACHRLPVWEVTFFRALINLLLLAPWALRNPAIVKTWRKEPGPLLLRGVAGCLSIFLYFCAIERIKLADAVMLNQSAPILVLILSALVLGERLTKRALVFIAIAFIGIMFVVKPDFHMTDQKQIIGSLAGLGSTFTAAISYVSIKVATRNIPSRLIVFSFAVVATIMSLIPTLFFFTLPVGQDWLCLLGAGIFATMAQEAMTRGIAGLPASVATPLLLTNVVFSSFLGWVGWNEIPDAWSFLGIFLIGSGLLGALRSKRVV